MGMISKSCEYGLRAVLYVAAQPGSSFVPIKQISNELDISFHFLTKILQKLTQHGLMDSYRGPSGGVALARPARSISLLEVIKAIEGNELFTDCVLGLGGCGSERPCPLHQEWAKERSRLEKMFGATSLDKLAAPIARGELRLADR